MVNDRLTAPNGCASVGSDDTPRSTSVSLPNERKSPVRSAHGPGGAFRCRRAMTERCLFCRYFGAYELNPEAEERALEMRYGPEVALVGACQHPEHPATINSKWVARIGRLGTELPLRQIRVQSRSAPNLQRGVPISNLGWPRPPFLFQVISDAQRASGRRDSRSWNSRNRTCAAPVGPMNRVGEKDGARPDADRPDSGREHPD